MVVFLFVISCLWIVDTCICFVCFDCTKTTDSKRRYLCVLWCVWEVEVCRLVFRELEETSVHSEAQWNDTKGTELVVRGTVPKAIKSMKSSVSIIAYYDISQLLLAVFDIFVCFFWGLGLSGCL